MAAFALVMVEFKQSWPSFVRVTRMEWTLMHAVPENPSAAKALRAATRSKNRPW